MRDIVYVVELAKAYGHAKITREALQDQIHAVPLLVVQFGVIAFADEFGDEAAAGFVVAAELPLVVDADGFWSINERDERVKDFPPG